MAVNDSDQVCQPINPCLRAIIGFYSSLVETAMAWEGFACLPVRGLVLHMMFMHIPETMKMMRHVVRFMGKAAKQLLYWRGTRATDECLQASKITAHALWVALACGIVLGALIWVAAPQLILQGD